MNQLHSKINIRSEDFKTNQTAMQSLVDDLKQKAEQIALGDHVVSHKSQSTC